MTIVLLPETAVFFFFLWNTEAHLQQELLQVVFANTYLSI